MHNVFPNLNLLSLGRLAETFPYVPDVEVCFVEGGKGKVNLHSKIHNKQVKKNQELGYVAR